MVYMACMRFLRSSQSRPHQSTVAFNDEESSDIEDRELKLLGREAELYQIFQPPSLIRGGDEGNLHR